MGTVPFDPPGESPAQAVIISKASSIAKNADEFAPRAFVGESSLPRLSAATG